MIMYLKGARRRQARSDHKMIIMPPISDIGRDARLVWWWWWWKRKIENTINARPRQQQALSTQPLAGAQSPTEQC